MLFYIFNIPPLYSAGAFPSDILAITQSANKFKVRKCTKSKWHFTKLNCILEQDNLVRCNLIQPLLSRVGRRVCVGRVPWAEQWQRRLSGREQSMQWHSEWTNQSYLSKGKTKLRRSKQRHCTQRKQRCKQDKANYQDGQSTELLTHTTGWSIKWSSIHSVQRSHLGRTRMDKFYTETKMIIRWGKTRLNEMQSSYGSNKTSSSMGLVSGT